MDEFAASDAKPGGLMRWAVLLAVVGGLVFAAGALFLGSALWHLAHLAGAGPTYVFVAPTATVVLAAASLAVLVGGGAVLRRARLRADARAARLALVALVATFAAWAAVGIALLLLAN